MTVHPLTTDVEKFLEKHDMADSAFGRAAVNDWRFVRDLRAGRDLRGSTETKVRTFMETYPRQAAA